MPSLREHACSGYKKCMEELKEKIRKLLAEDLEEADRGTLFTHKTSLHVCNAQQMQCYESWTQALGEEQKRVDDLAARVEEDGRKLNEREAGEKQRLHTAKSKADEQYRLAAEEHRRAGEERRRAGEAQRQAQEARSDAEQLRGQATQRNLDADQRLQEAEALNKGYDGAMRSVFPDGRTTVMENFAAYHDDKKARTKELKDSKDECGRLHAENERLRSENETLQSENETLQSEMETLQSENETLQSENETLQSENDLAKEKVRRLTTQKAATWQPPSREDRSLMTPSSGASSAWERGRPMERDGRCLKRRRRDSAPSMSQASDRMDMSSLSPSKRQPSGTGPTASSGFPSEVSFGGPAPSPERRERVLGSSTQLPEVAPNPLIGARRALSVRTSSRSVTTSSASRADGVGTVAKNPAKSVLRRPSAKTHEQEMKEVKTMSLVRVMEGLDVMEEGELKAMSTLDDALKSALAPHIERYRIDVIWQSLQKPVRKSGASSTKCGTARTFGNSLETAGMCACEFCIEQNLLCIHVATGTRPCIMPLPEAHRQGLQPNQLGYWLPITPA
ncbi:hypothetical protein LTR85_010143 [Meristemomyces frigidus]|nr:hypothetical protein LTR85_010143 [Meristemomyces frigidus]